MKQKSKKISIIRLIIFLITLCFLLFITVLYKSCSTQELLIISGSENKGLESLIQEFAQKERVKICIHYCGSIDIMLTLSEKGANIPHDAIWPANSIWLALGDQHKVVKHAKSIMSSPVILGVRRSIAERLKWINKPINISDILEATTSGKLQFSMTSATQSNSGCSAYIGFLYALAGRPDILQNNHLENPNLQNQVRNLLSKVSRSSGSSGWLKDAVVKHYEKFQAMFNYEAMIIEANKELYQMGKEPLFAIYPTDGIMIANSPLGFIDKGLSEKKDLFIKLQQYLLSDDVQRKIMQMGRRTGLVGLEMEQINKQIFNPDWGINVKNIISSVPIPEEAVIRNALKLYQLSLRKPSCTAYVVDVSGSMQGDGLNELKSALRFIFDPFQSERYMLQPSPQDIHMIIPFNSRPLEGIQVNGNKPTDMDNLIAFVHNLKAGGGTNIYAATARAMHKLSKINNINNYFPAIILMTDGRSRGNIKEVIDMMKTTPDITDTPIFSITFGDADKEQLKELSKKTIGRVFDGKNLIKAFRNAKGYN